MLVMYGPWRRRHSIGYHYWLSVAVKRLRLINAKTNGKNVREPKSIREWTSFSFTSSRTRMLVLLARTCNGYYGKRVGQSCLGWRYTRCGMAWRGLRGRGRGREQPRQAGAVGRLERAARLVPRRRRHRRQV